MTPELIEAAAQWIPIPGCIGYFANADGQILGRRGWILRGNVLSTGYTRITIMDGGQEIPWCRHGLIALTFIGPCPEGMQVDHINRNRQDDRAANLRYVSLIEQQQNKSTNVYYTINGETLCLTEWARRAGLDSSATIQRRLERGWALEDALTFRSRFESKYKLYKARATAACMAAQEEFENERNHL